MAEKKAVQEQHEATQRRREESLALALALEQKCSDYDIPIKVHKGPLGALVELKLPSGRDRRTVVAGGIEGLQKLLDVPLQKYVVLAEMQAICSYEEGTIEALVESASNAPARRILSRRLADEDGNVPSPFLTLSKENLTIALGDASEDLRGLLHRGPGSQAALALKISGASISRHDHAKDLLERVANALFLEIDTAFGLPLILGRFRRFQFVRSTRQRGADGIKFPVSEYDPQAMALYWYGRGATGMPLLRFLAFYQVLEFYFPIYADREIRQRVKSVVKDPMFKPHDEGHISRIMKAMSAGGRRGFADERSQLRAAVRGSTTPMALREFLLADEQRAKFFAEKKTRHSPAGTLLKAEMEDDDLLNATAERIYEIRCRIVHSKDSDGDRGQLLPFSPEADRMEHDIALMESMAHGALIAASRELRI